MRNFFWFSSPKTSGFPRPAFLRGTGSTLGRTQRPFQPRFFYGHSASLPDPVLLWTQRSSFRPCIPCRPAYRRSMCIGTAPPCLPCLPPVSCLHRHSASGVALLLYKAIFPSSFFNLNQQIRHPAHFIPDAGIAPAHRHSHPAALPRPAAGVVGSMVGTADLPPVLRIAFRPAASIAKAQVFAFLPLDAREGAMVRTALPPVSCV